MTSTQQSDVENEAVAVATASSVFDGDGATDDSAAEEEALEGTITLPRLMALSISTRLLVDTSAQIFSPFLSIFAAGMGISVVTLGQLMGLRSIMGLFAPWIGALADRRGYRLVMRWSLIAIIGGLILTGSSQGFLLLVSGMVVMGIGLAGFVPTLHAYLSNWLPYRIRARGLGILEYSWALAGIVGLYSMGRIIAWSNWRAPLFVLAGGLAFMWVLLGLLPKAEPAGAMTVATPTPLAEGTGGPWYSRISRFFAIGSNARSAYSAVTAQMLLFFAGMQLFIAHGAWLNREYALGAVELGTVALILGCFDLVASVSVSLVVDRIGKLRSVIFGCTGVLIGYLLIPWLNYSVVSAVVGITLTRAAFEFGIVSQISMMTEQAPEQRAKFMSISAAFVFLSGTIANFTGPWLYETQGVWGLSISSSLAMVVALALLLTQVQDASVE